MNPEQIVKGLELPKNRKRFIPWRRGKGKGKDKGKTKGGKGYTALGALPFLAAVTAMLPQQGFSLMMKAENNLDMLPTSSLAPYNQQSKIKFLDEDRTMDSQIFSRELYPSLNVIQPKEPQDPNNPLGFNQ